MKARGLFFNTFLLMPLFIAGSSPFGYAQEIIFRSTSSIFKRSTEVHVPTQNGESPSVYYSDSRKEFGTGRSAENLSEARKIEAATQVMLAARKAQNNKPEAPKQIEIRTGENQRLVGGLTELIPGSKIYITARHVLQDHDLSRIQQALKKADIDLGEMRVLGFKRGDSNLDAILLVPKGKESLVLEFAIPSTDCGNPAGLTLKLRELPEFEKYAKQDRRYVSFQYGSTGTKATSQTSQGVVSRVGDGKLFLDLNGLNYTSGRSSGAVVFTQDGSPKAPWKVGGVVECIIPASKDFREAPVPGSVQVISTSELLSAEVYPVPIELLVEEKIPSDKECIPVDGRSGGGD
jgi:hypothetical protein